MPWMISAVHLKTETETPPPKKKACWRSVAENRCLIVFAQNTVQEKTGHPKNHHRSLSTFGRSLSRSHSFCTMWKRLHVHCLPLPPPPPHFENSADLAERHVNEQPAAAVGQLLRWLVWSWHRTLHLDAARGHGAEDRSKGQSLLWADL